MLGTLVEKSEGRTERMKRMKRNANESHGKYLENEKYVR